MPRDKEYYLIKPSGNVFVFSGYLNGFNQLRQAKEKGDYCKSISTGHWYSDTETRVPKDQIPSNIKTICLLHSIPI